MIKNIIIEKPVSWMECKMLGSYVSILFNNLLDIILKYKLNIKIIDIYNNSLESGLPYFRNPDFNHSDTVYFSYHTYGDIIPNLFRIKESYIPGFFTIDPKGYSGFSLFSELQNISLINNIDYDEAFEYISTLKNNILINNISKYPQNNLNNLNLKNDFVFFPLQVENDSVLDLSNFNFYDLIYAVCDNINFTVVIKPHPFTINKDTLINTLSFIKSIKPNIIITDGPIHQLLQAAKCCITINSGVGFEALLQDTPVVTFGKSDYHMITQECCNINDINNNLINNCILNHNHIINIKFMYYYLKKYCIYYTDQVSTEKKINELLFNS